MQEFVLKKLLARKRVAKVGTAQLKITAVLIYYTVIGVMGLVTATLSFTSYATKSTREAITQYILCENSGESDCKLDSAIVSNVGNLSVAVIVLFSFLPVVAILFSCDPRACRRKAKTEMLSKKSSTMSAL